MNVKTHIREKKQAGDDLVVWAFDRHTLGTLTTEHSASSYGQPVVIRDGKLVDYSAIESLALYPEASKADFEAAKKLEAFGIKVSIHQPTDL